MPIYTSDRPPVIKANLGSAPWLNYATTLKPTVVIYDDAGAVQPVDTGEMVHVPGTPIWIYKVADRVTGGIPDTRVEWHYVVIKGVIGEIVLEGTLEIENVDISLEGAITDVHIVAPYAIEIPISVSNPKNYPIKFIPYAANGDIRTVDSVSISITFQVIGPNVVAAAMTNSGGVWSYNWNLTYTTPKDIVAIEIIATKGSTDYEYHRTTELFKAREFNPQRLSSGLLT